MAFLRRRFAEMAWHEPGGAAQLLEGWCGEDCLSESIDELPQ
jgi:hypothetical protein